MKWVVDVNNFKGNAITYLTESGICPYTGRTAASYIAEGYAILEEDEFFNMVASWEDSLCGDWKEVTEEDYDDALNVLPPVGWYGGGFFMSERYTGNVSSFYQKLNGKYYSSLQRMSTPRKAILDDLRTFAEC